LPRIQLRRYLLSRYPGSLSVNHYIKAVVAAVTAGGAVKATSDTLLVRHRELRIAAFAFVIHSEFPEPGMHRIDALLERATVRAMLWQPQQLLPALSELRNRGLIAKVSEIDRFRQFTTQWTPAELSVHLSQGDPLL
jgi:hypothetical protein